MRAAAALLDRSATLGLTVRAGIHVGEVEMLPHDIAGIAVHIATRVSDIARPGEVVVSGVVPPLIAGSGIRFEDRGFHELKGVEGEWQVLAASA